MGFRGSRVQIPPSRLLKIVALQSLAVAGPFHFHHRAVWFVVWFPQLPRLADDLQ